MKEKKYFLLNLDLNLVFFAIFFVFLNLSCSKTAKNDCVSGSTNPLCASQLDSGSTTKALNFSISPTVSEKLVNESITFAAAGGSGVYTYALQEGSVGSIVSSTGVYTSSQSGNAVVIVVDSESRRLTATVSVYDALSVSPLTTSVATNGSVSFSVAGGVPPLSYSIASGSGTIDNNGTFTAPNSSGTNIIRVTDKNGHAIDATVTVYGLLAVVSSSVNIPLSGSTSISTIGGIAPISFSILSGSGSVNSSTGVYSAPGTSGSAVVRATDASGNHSDASINIYDALTISPSNSTLYVTASQSFSATGGVLPYTYSVSGGGTINASTGYFTAGSSTGSFNALVTDSIGNVSSTQVTIAAAPTNVAISPASKSLIINESQTFAGIGGVGPYGFAVVSTGGCASPVGTVDPSTGVFSSSTPGCSVVRVTDSQGSPTTSDSTINIYNTLSISSVSSTLLTSNSYSISSSGGIAPIGFSVVTLGTDASINSSNGTLTTPSTTGSLVVRATDAVGNTAVLNLTIVNPVTLNPSSLSLVVNENKTFTASGGSGTYTFSTTSGNSTINSSSGIFTASSSAETATVHVVDSNGYAADATITVSPLLAINPTTASISTLGTQTFTASGGVGSKTFSVVSGPGSPSINSSTGVLLAGSSAGTIVVRVTDSASPTPHTSDATITVSSMSVSPTTWDLVQTEAKQFTVSGGVAPYAYSITTGNGSLNVASNSSGIFTYTSAAITENITILIVDSNSNQVSVTVNVHSPLTITPGAVSISLNGAQSFDGAGGVPPLSYSIVSGGGSLSSNNFTAPSSAGSVIVRVTDSALPTAHTADSTVTVSNTLTLNSPSQYVQTDGSLTFTASGGNGPYTFEVVNTGAQGSYDLSTGTACYSGCTGEYTAPSTAITATVTVRDSTSATATKTIYVYAPITISPTTKLLSVSGTQTFTATGGYSTKSFSVVSGSPSGSINLSTGVFTATASAGTVVVRIADSIGNHADATVTVSSSLSISPVSATISTNSLLAFTSINGASPVFSVFSGSGSVTNGTFTAPNSAGSSTVRVTDSGSNTADSAVTIVSPKKIFAGQYNTCILFSNDKLRCWGDGSKGQLANNGTNAIGDSATTSLHKLGNDFNYGASANFLDFGTGITVKDLAIGIYHMCAIVNTDQVKCWGDNTKGQLGIDSTTAVGTSTVALKNSAYVNLGSGRTAKMIAVAGYTSCAILDDDTLKCWGDNTKGQLGQGSTTPYGNSTATTGTLGLSMSVLNAINLGTGRTAKKVAVMSTGTTTNAVCAILDNDSLVCWGDNTYGEVGQGTTTATYSTPPATAVNLGTNLVAKSIYGGRYSFCAILHDKSGTTNENKVKCWGRNRTGQMGQNAAAGTSVYVGTSATHMGDNLLYVATGATITPTLGTTSVNTTGVGTPIVVKSMSIGYSTACAIIDNGLSANTIKCWGDSALYQAVPGTTGSLLMPVLVPSAVIPSGMEPEYVVTGVQHSCALGTQATGYKAFCWGTTSTTSPKVGLLGNNAVTLQSGGSATVTNSGSAAIIQLPY